MSPTAHARPLYLCLLAPAVSAAAAGDGPANEPEANAGASAHRQHLRWAPGRTEAGEERPRWLVVAVNQRALRLVGMEHPESTRVVVFK